MWFRRNTTVIDFPDPRNATVDGIVAFGGALTTANLLRAYRRGIFPWPIEGLPLPWFCPPERGILEFKELHVPRSLRHARNRSRLRFSFNQAFPAVIRACALTPRAGESGTWITPQIVRAYGELHQLGHAHSVEAWEDDMLAGGLYGVEVDGAFGGESMFYKRPNASKLALLFLIERLQARGLDWMDVQMMTPHMAALGARLIKREEFLEKLAETRARGLKLFGDEMSNDGEAQ
ncbi:MAG: leucyl/phenylalanyl-tRNA---protein transferase [Blastocatellia bacterium]|jgi:leucyl/phenylalanyl-tRNA--protein transferase|nr:leucyl/phenylalanyl-tRNA---protein transferase [Blastocatellia bacterium]